MDARTPATLPTPRVGFAAGSSGTAVIEQELVRRVVVICLLLMVCDSYNVAAMAYAAPVVIARMQITPFAMGLVFSAGLTGLLIGSLALGRLGDRVGRKRTILLGTLAFSVLTVATGSARDEATLATLRFLSGIGLGGVVPNAIALVGEFAPPRARATAVGIIFSGYAAGGILAGLAAALLVPTSGWQSLFTVGGCASIVVAGIVAIWLPESQQYRQLRPTEALPSAGEPPLLEQVALRAEPSRTSTPHALFAGWLSLATPLLWGIYILTSITVFSLASWMPAIISKAGLSGHVASLSTALLYTGGALGGICGGRLADRFGFRAAAAIVLVGVPLVLSIGLVTGSEHLLLALSFLAGSAALGGQTTIHSLAPLLYDTHSRATGTGWALGIGKAGSILGPFAGGLLLERLTPQILFVCASAPLLFAVAGLMALDRVFRARA